MGANTGLPAKVSYSAYNTNTQQFVAGDEAQHSLSLRLDGVSAAPTNSPVSVGNGVYEITLTAAERLGVDLVLSGSSSTADIIICPIQFSADGRWNELLEDDGSGNLRNTVKSLEQAPVADVSNLALEASVQTIITTGGAGPWTTGLPADVSNLALEASVQLILATGGVGPWTTYAGGASEGDWTITERNQIRNRLGIDGAAEVPGVAPTLSLQVTSDTIVSTGGAGPWTTGLPADLTPVMDILNKLTFNANDILQVDVQWWQGVEISGLNMIEDPTGQPRWTIRALSLAPSGGEGGTIVYVNVPTMLLGGYLEILRGDTLEFPVMLGIGISGVTEIVFVLKEDTYDLDSESLLYISSVDGLKYINKEVAVTAANAMIVTESTVSGVIRISCAAVEMAKLPEKYRGAVADIQLKTGDSIFTPWRKKVSIEGDVARAT